MTAYFGYIGAFFIGLVLGLTGGGGAILTVPLLVYVMQMHPVTASAYSLFIVGTTSAFGTLQNFRKGIVDVKTAFLFAIPSFTAVFLTRKFIVPAIPEIVFSYANLVVTKAVFLMVLFAIIMLVAAYSMLRHTKIEKALPQNTHPLPIIIKVFLIGILIGLVGAGGGFLLTPALMVLAKLPIRKAIGTSLLIIALNSLIGFTGDLGHIVIDWILLFVFSAIAIVGIYIGIFLSKFANEQQLKNGFGWFVFLMAIVILVTELFFK